MPPKGGAFADIHLYEENLNCFLTLTYISIAYLTYLRKSSWGKAQKHCFKSLILCNLTQK